MSRTNKIILMVVSVIVIISLIGILWYKYNDNEGFESADTENKLPAVKVTLTNGCGFEGLAKDFSDFLSDKNVDIVSMGNTRLPINDKTYIVILKGDKEDLHRLQRMTGIDRYTEVLTESALADFEIIIGKDYEQYINK